MLLSWYLVTASSRNAARAAGRGFPSRERQEDVKGFFVQRKEHGIKHLSCSFLKSGSHLPSTELFSGAADGLSFAVQKTTAFTY